MVDTKNLPNILLALEHWQYNMLTELFVNWSNYTTNKLNNLTTKRRLFEHKINLKRKQEYLIKWQQGRQRRKEDVVKCIKLVL
eukprot:UN09015